MATRIDGGHNVSIKPGPGKLGEHVGKTAQEIKNLLPTLLSTKNDNPTHYYDCEEVEAAVDAWFQKEDDGDGRLTNTEEAQSLISTIMNLVQIVVQDLNK